jgi:hypothetical protein
MVTRTGDSEDLRFELDTLLELTRIGAERPEVEDPMPRGKYAQA